MAQRSKDRQGQWPDNFRRPPLVRSGPKPKVVSLSQARGAAAERAVLVSLADLMDPRVRSARKASDAEDRSGVDIVLELTSGPAFIQVKSSRSTVGGWRRKHGNDPRVIEIVVVHDPENVHKVNQAVREALDALIYRTAGRHAVPV